MCIRDSQFLHRVHEITRSDLEFLLDSFFVHNWNMIRSADTRTTSRRERTPKAISPAHSIQRQTNGGTMKRTLLNFAGGACALVLAQHPAHAQTKPVVTLTRMACGTNAAPTDVAARFSDTWAWPSLMVQLTFSCYLIRHGDDYLVWDTGNPVGSAATAPKVSIVDLLAQLNVSPSRVKYVAISHYHGDHT